MVSVSTGRKVSTATSCPIRRSSGVPIAEARAVIEPHDLYERRRRAEELDVDIARPIEQRMARVFHEGKHEPEHKAQARADQAELERHSNAADQIRQIPEDPGKLKVAQRSDRN